MDLRIQQVELCLQYITSTKACHSYETMSATMLNPEEHTALATYLAHMNITKDNIHAMVSTITVL